MASANFCIVLFKILPLFFNCCRHFKRYVGANMRSSREFKSRDDEAGEKNSYSEPLILLPLEIMVKPLELRFQYHFDGDRPTNKLSKVCSTITIENNPRAHETSPNTSSLILLVCSTRTTNSLPYTSSQYCGNVSRVRILRSRQFISTPLPLSSPHYYRCYEKKSLPQYRKYLMIHSI